MLIAMWAKGEKWGASFFCAKKDLSLFHLQNPPVYKALLGFSTDLRGEGNWQKELSFRAGEVECVHSGCVDAVECVLCDGLSRVCLCRFLTAAISSLSLQKKGNFLRCFWIKRWINFFEIPVFMRFKSNNYLIVQQKGTVFCGEKPASFFWRTGCDARIGNGWQADLRNASDGRRIGSEVRAGFFLRPSQGGEGVEKIWAPHSLYYALPLGNFFAKRRGKCVREIEILPYRRRFGFFEDRICPLYFKAIGRRFARRFWGYGNMFKYDFCAKKYPPDFLYSPLWQTSTQTTVF